MAEETNSGYGLLSRYRGELMGLATLGIMLLHTYQLQLTSLPLRAIRQMGFAGVDVFLLLSGMGICLSLHRRAGEPLGQYYRRRCRRLLPAFWLVVGLYSAGLALAGRIRSNYRFVIGFNGGLIALGLAGVLAPATSATLHNLSTLGVSLRSMSPLPKRDVPKLLCTAPA